MDYVRTSNGIRKHVAPRALVSRRASLATDAGLDPMLESRSRGARVSCRLPAMPADAPSPVAERREPHPFAVPARLPDVFNPLSPGRVTLRGPLGQRVTANASRRLVEVDLEPLLAGFR